jgi:hypothetical protein
MDEHLTEQSEAVSVLEMTIYEQLWLKLYAYHFGTIGFLELLDTFEQILHITPPQTTHDLD